MGDKPVLNNSELYQASNEALLESLRANIEKSYETLTSNETEPKVNSNQIDSRMGSVASSYPESSPELVNHEVHNPYMDIARIGENLKAMRRYRLESERMQLSGIASERKAA